MLPSPMRFAIYLQIAYGLLVAAWQVVGLMRMASGEPALGPTASGGVAVFALASLGALVALAQWRPGLYVVLAALLGVPALAAIQNAFVADAALWPSPWARWGGVALNALGVVAPALAFLGWRRMREEPVP